MQKKDIKFLSCTAENLENKKTSGYSSKAHCTKIKLQRAISALWLINWL